MKYLRRGCALLLLIPVPLMWFAAVAWAEREQFVRDMKTHINTIRSIQ